MPAAFKSIAQWLVYVGLVVFAAGMVIFGKVRIPFTHVAPSAGAGSLVAMI